METVTPITYKGRPAVFGHFMDITDRKAMEEKISESETLYRTIFETTGTATIIIEEDTTVCPREFGVRTALRGAEAILGGKAELAGIRGGKGAGAHAPVSQPEAHGPQGGAGAATNSAL